MQYHKFGHKTLDPIITDGTDGKVSIVNTEDGEVVFTIAEDKVDALCKALKNAAAASRKADPDAVKYLTDRKSPAKPAEAEKPGK